MAQRLSDVKKLNDKKGIITPSQYAFPVLVMCPPVYADNAIHNNPTMDEPENAKPIDRDKFMAQWYNLYNVAAANSLIYVMPPHKSFQDLVYVNQFAYLPHYKKKDTIILSNFVGEGRPGEEIVAGTLLKQLGYDVVQCPYKFEGEPECFDDETEILTDDGWKYFKDLKKSERVMTYDPGSNSLEFQKPTAYQGFRRKGKMIRFKNRYVDSLVTPNHQVYCRNEGTSGYSLVSAENVRKNFYFKITAEWNGGNGVKDFHIPVGELNKNGHTDKRNYTFPIEQWVEFLGWYLSEGYCNQKSYQVWLCQSIKANPDKYREIEILLMEMGFRVSHGEFGLIINSKRLCGYLKQFGHAYDKFIPNEIKQLPAKYLRILIETMMKGDGSRKRTVRYASASKRLADDFQEICLKCGIPAIIGTTSKTVDGRKFTWFVVYQRKNNETIFKHFGQPARQKWHMRNWNKQEVDYDGFVYDVTVPKHHILLVRRNGRPFLSGNCKWLHDDIYIGGYGFRSDIRAHEWIEENYGAKIIKLRETDPVLYHLDCSVFPIGRENVIMATELMDPDTVKEVEKVSNVIWCSKQDAYAGICNSLQIDDCIYNGSSLQYMKRTDKDYEETKRKDERLEQICRDLGQELVYFDLGETEKSGGKLSCAFGHLNFH